MIRKHERHAPWPTVGRSARVSAIAAAMLATAAAASAAPAIAQHVNCRVTVGGRTTGGWAGSCRNGMADGTGAVRVAGGVFAGLAAAGRPVAGITVTADGGYLMTTRRPARVPDTMDEASAMSDDAFDNALRGAIAAETAYRAAGNAASARYYGAMHRGLVKGRPE